MNKLYTILILCFLSFGVKAQFTNTTNSGSATTLQQALGGYKGKLGFILPDVVADTTAANSMACAAYAGAIIQTAAKEYWIRQLVPNLWVKLNTSAASLVSISQAYGILNVPNPIVTVGTIGVDTIAMSTRAWNKKGNDSLGAIISGLVTGVSSVTGFPNEITASPTTGAVGLRLPTNVIISGTLSASGLISLKTSTVCLSATAVQPNITSVGTLTGLTVIATINGSITGNAATVSMLDNNSSSAEYYPMWTNSTNPNANTFISSTKLFWNPGSGIFTVPKLRASVLADGAALTDSIVVVNGGVLKKIPANSYSQYLTPFSSTSLTTISPYTNFSVTGTINAGVLSSLSTLSNDILATPSGSNAGMRVRDASYLNSIYPSGFVASPLNSNRVSVSVSNAPSTGTYVAVYTNLNSTNLDTNKVNFIQAASGTPWTGALLPTTMTASRQWLLPNQSGTIALTSDINNLWTRNSGTGTLSPLTSTDMVAATGTNGTMFYGIATTGKGVEGDATSGSGIYGVSTGSGNGVYAANSSTGNALSVQHNGTGNLANLANAGATVTVIANNGTLTTTGSIQGANLTVTGSTSIGGLTATGGAIRLTPTLYSVGSSTATDAMALTTQAANSSYNLRFKYSDGTDAGGFLHQSVGGPLVLNNSFQNTILAGTGSRAVLADANGLLSAPVSDSSLKMNIKILDSSLYKLMKLKPITYEFKPKYKNYGQGRIYGQLAQDVEKVFPELVFTTPQTGKKGINYGTGQYEAILTKALQEANNKIDAQAKELLLQAARLAKLETIINKQK